MNGVDSPWKGVRMHFLPRHHKILAGIPRLFAQLSPVEAGPGRGRGMASQVA